MWRCVCGGGRRLLFACAAEARGLCVHTPELSAPQHELLQSVDWDSHELLPLSTASEGAELGAVVVSVVCRIFFRDVPFTMLGWSGHDPETISNILPVDWTKTSSRNPRLFAIVASDSVVHTRAGGGERHGRQSRATSRGC